MNDKLDCKIKGFQNILYRESEKIIDSLIKQIDPDANNTIDLDKMRTFLNRHKSQAGLNDNFIKILSNYKLTEMLTNGEIKDGKYNTKITKNELVEFICGKNIKNMIFNMSLYDKKSGVEDLFNVYNMMSDESSGYISDISAKELSLKLSRNMKFYNKPERYFKNDYDPKTDNERNYNKEAEEIIEYLSTGAKDKLSLNDFVNAMTTEFLSDFDLIAMD